MTPRSWVRLDTALFSADGMAVEEIAEVMATKARAQKADSFMSSRPMQEVEMVVIGKFETVSLGLVGSEQMDLMRDMC
jgi:hypothetical protein